MRVYVFIIAACPVLVCFEPSALAQGSQNGIPEPFAPAAAEKPPQQNKEVDVKLYAFCQQAILHDRGLSNSLLAGNSDRWIVEELLKEKVFIQALGGLRSDLEQDSDKEDAGQGRVRKETSRKRQASRTSGWAEFYTKHSEETEILEKQLTEEGRARLPSVYLQLEGLIALIRPEFQNIFDEPKAAQDKIRELTNKLVSQKAGPLHQTLFALPDFEQAPIYAAELRRVSAELDWKIVEILSPAERLRLLTAIRKARRFEKVVHGPGPY